jgi:hypothetical protein
VPAEGVSIASRAEWLTHLGVTDKETETKAVLRKEKQTPQRRYAKGNGNVERLGKPKDRPKVPRVSRLKSAGEGEVAQGRRWMKRQEF